MVTPTGRAADHSESFTRGMESCQHFMLGTANTSFPVSCVVILPIPVQSIVRSLWKHFMHWCNLYCFNRAYCSFFSTNLSLLWQNLSPLLSALPPCSWTNKCTNSCHISGRTKSVLVPKILFWMHKTHCLLLSGHKRDNGFYVSSTCFQVWRLGVCFCKLSLLHWFTWCSLKSVH